MAAIVLALAAAVPLRGTGDVRSDIERIVVLEGNTAGAYDAAAVDRFRQGRTTAASLARLIEGTIVPELQAARAHLKAVDRVPKNSNRSWRPPRNTLLREKAWRMRADALLAASMPALREADRVERDSQDAFRRIRSFSEGTQDRARGAIAVETAGHSRFSETGSCVDCAR